MSEAAACQMNAFKQTYITELKLKLTYSYVDFCLG